MLGIRLNPEIEAALDRHAKAIGRPKSVIARDWITERLERESVDAQMAQAARILADDDADAAWRDEMTSMALRALDDEDGGYDSGPEGPPACR